MSQAFIQGIASSDWIENPKENIYLSLFKQYERVIIESLITSFGLDFIIKDQHGGDVDTVHNVRKIGQDPNMSYKNRDNEKTYNERGDYDDASYHGNDNFRLKKHAAREKFYETGEKIKDTYTGRDIGFHGRTQAVSSEQKAELDHVVECKAIHEDRGRVLSEIRGEDLANMDDNLAFTNKSLNASMGAWARGVNDKYRKEHGCDAPIEMVDMKAYLDSHPDIDSDTRKRMLKQYNKSRKAYEARIASEYYTSPKFFKDTAVAAGAGAFKMGLRQVLGLVFSEIWFEAKDVILIAKVSGKELYQSIARGVQNGFNNAKIKYKDLWNKFVNGAIAGALSSLTTTICNIFFTTAKNIVRIIRQSWASLVEATKILLFNPDFLPLGERCLAATKILASGASIVAGTFVGEIVSKSPVGGIPVIGEICITFSGTLVTGILTCSLLFYLDRNSAIQDLINALNKIPTVDDQVRYYIVQSKLLDEYAAKLMDINLNQFKSELSKTKEVFNVLLNCTTHQETNQYLRSIYMETGWGSPLEGYNCLDSFMVDKDSILSFK